ncbi:MAG: hypothetical protein JWO56_1238 [Acidobacteria bacterium]|nr:hypothetical protein [Acidobacteriota bacterium]
MNLPGIALWGFVATTMLTTMTVAGQTLGLTRIDIPFILGTFWTANRDRARVLGYVVHVANGWLFALAYALIFESVHDASLEDGALMGLVQGLVITCVILPLLPGIHPRMVSDSRGPEPTRLLEPPGYLSMNYGRLTPLVTLVAHTAYGAILGAMYMPGR